MFVTSSIEPTREATVSQLDEGPLTEDECVPMALDDACLEAVQGGIQQPHGTFIEDPV